MLSFNQFARDLHLPLPATELAFGGVSIDSRTLNEGDLFVSIKGENFDGHDFIPAAIGKGARALLVDRPVNAALPQLQVADTRRALGQLGKAHRQRMTLPILAITGSNGKTTSKEMCAAVLRSLAAEQGQPQEAVLSTAGNLNNDLGVPLTLLHLTSRHAWAVIEMGSNHQGEIASLCELASPTLGLVTNVGRAHMSQFSSLAKVAEEKGALFVSLPTTGTALINRDDAFYNYWRDNCRSQFVTFGLHADAMIRADYTQKEFGTQIRLKTPKDIVQFHLPLPGRHNVINALAACAVGYVLGLSSRGMAEALQHFQAPPGRLHQRHGLKGTIIIDDAYNANPDSVRTAIEVLSAFTGKRIFVFGDMGEIGEKEAEWHGEVGQEAKTHGVDVLFTLGKSSRLATQNFGKKAQHFDTVEDLLLALHPLLSKNTMVLVKGSRFMKMERIIEAIVAKKESSTKAEASHAL